MIYEKFIKKGYIEGKEPYKDVNNCRYCEEYKGKMHPSHNGSQYCESGSIASGGKKSHCTCDICF